MSNSGASRLNQASEWARIWGGTIVPRGQSGLPPEAVCKCPCTGEVLDLSPNDEGKGSGDEESGEEESRDEDSDEEMAE
jgi:hypothetical protein